MRLINNDPIIQLRNIHLSPNTFGLARKLFACGERLKVTEQKLNFLRRCKSRKLFPKFINNNVHINQTILFPLKFSYRDKALVHSLKLSSLNQFISRHYNSIRLYKRDICHVKKQLIESGLSRVIINQLVRIFDDNNESVKQTTKLRNQKKFDDLLNGSSSDVIIDSDQNAPSQLSDSPAVDTSCIAEPVEDRVTAIQVNLSPEEQSLLALGPKFALTPRIDETLMDTVKAEIASCAYKLRWMTFMDNTASCPTALQHLKRTGCPFQRPFTSAPPTFNVETEDALKQLHNFILRQISHAKLKFNLSNSQAAGSKSLKERKAELHISVSDKGGEFVVMNRNSHKDLTTNHITSTGVYKFVPPTRKYQGQLREVKKPTETTYSRQISEMVSNLESQANSLWSSICKKRGIRGHMLEFFKAHNTRLPTMYVLLKTHKFETAEITSESDILIFVKKSP